MIYPWWAKLEWKLWLIHSFTHSLIHVLFTKASSFLKVIVFRCELLFLWTGICSPFITVVSWPYFLIKKSSYRPKIFQVILQVLYLILVLIEYFLFGFLKLIPCSLTHWLMNFNLPFSWTWFWVSHYSYNLFAFILKIRWGNRPFNVPLRPLSQLKKPILTSGAFCLRPAPCTLAFLVGLRIGLLRNPFHCENM